QLAGAECAVLRRVRLSAAGERARGGRGRARSGSTTRFLATALTSAHTGGWLAAATGGRGSGARAEAGARRTESAAEIRRRHLHRPGPQQSLQGRIEDR